MPSTSDASRSGIGPSVILEWCNTGIGSGGVTGQSLNNGRFRLLKQQNNGRIEERGAGLTDGVNRAALERDGKMQMALIQLKHSNQTGTPEAASSRVKRSHVIINLLIDISLRTKEDTETFIARFKQACIQKTPNY